MAYFSMAYYGLRKTWKSKVSHGLLWLTSWLTLGDGLLPHEGLRISGGGPSENITKTNKILWK